MMLEKMRQPSDEEVKIRIRFDNPWWDPTAEDGVLAAVRDMPKRTHFAPFLKQVKQTDIRRAIVLMGPRRVGKTVMLRQTIQSLIDDGVDPNTIFYASLETPNYIGLGLERLFRLFCDMRGHNLNADLFVFFDEVQYLKGWEVHLKSFVDSFIGTKAVVSGSAAAALRYASNESGAGRFSDFLLPALSFAEFLRFSTDDDLYAKLTGLDSRESSNISTLNEKLIEYLNYGGFPEAVMNSSAKADFQKYIGEDVLSKVMLRDLPSLYGIEDPQELNQFFALLALNTGTEVNFEKLSQTAGVALNTIKRYVSYLEAAFLIRRVERIDRNARRFKRAATFKVYLTNPCLRAALFGPIDSNSPDMGPLVETALFAGYLEVGSTEQINYARWNDGEVDFVFTKPDGTPSMCTECKWSDVQDEQQMRSYISFAKHHRLERLTITTKSILKNYLSDGLNVSVVPTAWMLHFLGFWNAVGFADGDHLSLTADGAPILQSAPSKPSL
jgi:predicted AAA+ superfamily ATPase